MYLLETKCYHKSEHSKTFVEAKCDKLIKGHNFFTRLVHFVVQTIKCYLRQNIMRGVNPKKSNGLSLKKLNYAK